MVKSMISSATFDAKDFRQKSKALAEFAAELLAAAERLGDWRLAEKQVAAADLALDTARCLYELSMATQRRLRSQELKRARRAPRLRLVWSAD